MSDEFERDNLSGNSENYDEAGSSQNVTSESNQTNSQTAEESSYEWNSQPISNGEYRHSYVNGNNSDASHNPNNYENAYSTPRQETSYDRSYEQNTDSQNSYGNNYNRTVDAGNSQSYAYNNGNAQNAYNGTYQYQGYAPYNTQMHKAKKVKKPKVKKPKKPASRGFIAAMLAITIVASAGVGFGGGYLASTIGKASGSSINVTKVESSESNATNTSADSATASSVVKKAADSVVEIKTESIVTGSFARQYIATGAGSGVIISEDGYIITNNHVIEDAKTITVTLRDGSTSYDATLVGTDAENDIALLKVEASGLSAATIGDSSNLAVGDYVVAIGNPLGELGGTVTDGIISALAREVQIEDENMTLLQTNAQINPGNSGGGLFNSNGELIGIVNAKESATEVEGIGFAIPINNAIKVVDDLKTYGYVTGKVDTGMEFVDINSTETAFYYGVNKIGCYVLSVDSNSNAEKAGFKSGDYINSVDGTAVSSSSEIDALLDKKSVGDTVTFNITRDGKTSDLQLTLTEYVPSKTSDSQSTTYSSSNDNSIWSEMFGW